MGYYVIAGALSATSTTAFEAATTTGGSSPRRAKYCEMVMGAVANPNASTDTALTFDVVRVGGAGAPSAATAYTPVPVDSAEAAATTIAAIQATTHASVVANSTLAYFPINQRNTVRWVAVQESQMLMFPGIQSTGGTLRCLVATGGFTASIAATITLME